MNTNMGHTGKLLCEERLMHMVSDFSNWRIDDFIRQMERERKKGRILPFVRGLRLSAHLIYAIRESLGGTGLTANWGHLLDENQNFCSCECDVIIHKEGHFRQWNDTKNPIMDFRFIEQQKTVAVISCKSYLRTSDIDKEYCEYMKPFCKNIWLFAECCGSRSAKNIRQKALSFGYKKFWYLYSWSEKTDPQPNRDGWSDFVKEVKRLMQ